jgi:hypothetical protein
MSITEDLDFRDLMLEVQAELGEIVDELLSDLAAPQIKQAVAQQYASLSPQQKENIYRTNPDAHAAIQKIIKP